MWKKTEVIVGLGKEGKGNSKLISSFNSWTAFFTITVPNFCVHFTSCVSSEHTYLLMIYC